MLRLPKISGSSIDGELKSMKNGENQKFLAFFLTRIMAKIRNIAKN